jgi:hypothetical protein
MYPEFGPSNVRPDVSRFVNRMEGKLVIGNVTIFSESLGTSPFNFDGPAMPARLTPEFLLLSFRHDVK